MSTNILHQTVDVVHKMMLISALRRNEYRLDKAAEQMGIALKTAYNWLDKYDLQKWHRGRSVRKPYPPGTRRKRRTIGER